MNQRKRDVVVIPEALRAALEVMTGKKNEAGKYASVSPEVLCASNRILREEVLRRKRAEEEKKNPKPGAMVAGEGIFIVQYAPIDRYGRALKKIFNVYAAPEDLIDDNGQHALGRYGDIAQYVARRKKWHGFDGGYYVNDIELYNALRDEKYYGEWVIPPSEILAGRDINARRVKADSLYSLRDKGDLVGSFVEENKLGGMSNPEKYWSCTDYGHTNPDYSLYIKFSNGEFGGERKTFLRLSCRPVRFVEVKP